MNIVSVTRKTHPDYKLKWESINPAKAAVYLATSPGNPRWKNRIVSPASVAPMVRDMLSGNWEATSNPIIFDEDGNLLDGHHRLTGVVIAGETDPNIEIMFLVLRGEPRTNAAYIDGNTARTAAQRLGISNAAAAVCTIHFQLIGMAGTNDKISPDELAGVYEKYKEGILYADSFPYSSPVGTAAFRHSVFAAKWCGVPDETLRRFAEIVRTGLYDGEKETAAVMIRNAYLKTPRAATVGSTKLAFARTVELAISYFVGGVPRKRAFNAPNYAVYTDQMED